MNKLNILNDPFKNKGTAFTSKERRQLGIEGALPNHVQTLDDQVKQAYQQYQTKQTNFAKRQFLMQIFDTNRVLFYKLFSQHIAEFVPIVYNPTVAEDIEKYSDIFIKPQYSAYLSINTQKTVGDMKKAMLNVSNGRDIRLIVVTDAESILGIGDWGLNGVDICVGKLMVYTAAGGINPYNVLPVDLDVGTNNKKLLDDPNYLGYKHPRVVGKAYYDFLHKFVTAAEEAFPDLYLHFEDFRKDKAINVLDKANQKYAVFNDDIEGTGAMMLSAILGGLKISKEKLSDQRYVCFGAGTAGMGIVNTVYREFIRQGMSPQAAKKHFYLVGRQGLMFKDDPKINSHQKVFARDESEFKHPEKLNTLAGVVKAIHPTILIGTSGAPHTFTKEIVQDMTAHTSRPIICPISNPTELQEATPEDILKWSNGKALIATGVPHSDIKGNNGVSYKIGYANNALIFPGIGLGAVSVNATKMSPQMISSAAHALGKHVESDKPGASILPPLNKLVELSNYVAVAVGKTAVKQGFTKQKINIDDVPKLVKKTRWSPHY